LFRSLFKRRTPFVLLLALQERLALHQQLGLEEAADAAIVAALGSAAMMRRSSTGAQTVSTFRIGAHTTAPHRTAPHRAAPYRVVLFIAPAPDRS
jgi:hypothetical protein